MTPSVASVLAKILAKLKSLFTNNLKNILAELLQMLLSTDPEQTVRASVSPKILEKADRLFTNNLSDILVELLQNSRRARATRVDITAETRDSGTYISVRDNGTGIEDFGALLRLGDSDWDAETAAREDPAGMGFFSLLHHGVTVMSLRQRAVITKEGFLGKEPVRIVRADNYIAGTEIEFLRPEKRESVEAALKSVGRYGRLRIFLDDVEIDRVDFLADALFVKQAEGVRIGVFDHSIWEPWNFHGRLIRTSSPSLSQVLVDEAGKTRSLEVRFDVLETTSVRLKLPDRTAIVEDDRYAALCENAKTAMYEYLHSLPDHCASFRQYQEAHALGVPLKEASPWFRAFTVRPAEGEADYGEFFGERKKLAIEPLDRIAVVDLDESADDPFAFTFQTSLDHFEKLDMTPVALNRSYEGYSWYDSIPVLTDFTLLVDGKPACDIEPGSLLYLAETITLSFVLDRKDGRRERLDWSLPFAAQQVDFTDPVLYVTKTSPWILQEGVAEPFDLVDAATHIAFSPCDDVEADSRDTQLDYFQSETQTAIIRALGGAVAQAKHHLAKAIADWPLSSALRDAKVSEIRLHRDGESSNWNIELIAA